MQPPDELRDGSRGANWLNKLLAFVKSTRLVEGVGYELNQTTRGVSLVIRPGKGGKGSSTLKRYRVKEVGNDVIVANAIASDGSVSTADTRIAKPFNLRSQGWNGVTITYPLEDYPTAPQSLAVRYAYQSSVYRIASVTTTAGTTQEHQIIVPRYVPLFSEILVAEPENGTGVADTTLIDLNADGRAWAKAL